MLLMVYITNFVKAHITEDKVAGSRSNGVATVLRFQAETYLHFISMAFEVTTAFKIINLQWWEPATDL